MSLVLARRWGVDPVKCLLAALIHDLAKPYPANVQREKLDQCTAVPATNEDRYHPAVWHGFVSAQEAVDLFGVDDPEVLEAVAYHSTGCRNLGPVGLVLYVADFMEPSRRWKGVEAFRSRTLAGSMVERAYEVAVSKLDHLERKGQPAHSRTSDMADWLVTLLTKGNA